MRQPCHPAPAILHVEIHQSPRGYLLLMLSLQSSTTAMAQTKIVVDILENLLPTPLLEILLQDRTTEENIFWACNDYEELGSGYSFSDPITLDAIRGEHGRVIMPRVMKHRDLKRRRTKEKAEIFTPAWVCNLQCNCGDDGYLAEGVSFNYNLDAEGREWEATTEPIRFAEGVTWQDYILRTCMEITCGEAPYLASRYDAVTGEPIPIYKRIGLLDRKLRVVGENVSDRADWLVWVVKSFQSVYGYEWQGDNILLARENMLYTFIEYYRDRWGEEPTLAEQTEIAEVVAWNIFQMDGLKFVIPNSCHEEVQHTGLFEADVKRVPCPGCKKNDPLLHNGIYAKIRDWQQDGVLHLIDVYRQGKARNEREAMEAKKAEAEQRQSKQHKKKQ